MIELILLFTGAPALYAIVLCFKGKIFSRKIHFFIISAVSVWILSSLLDYIIDPPVGTSYFLFFIFYPCLCLLVMNILGKMKNIKFSFYEYFSAFMLYIPSQIIYIILLLAVYTELGIPI